MNKFLYSIIFSFIILMSFQGNASATVLTFEDGKVYIDEIPPSWTIIDFSQFSGDFEPFRNDPIQIGGLVNENVTLSAEYSNNEDYEIDGSSYNSANNVPVNSLIGNGTVDLGAAGIWNSDRNGYAYANGDVGALVVRLNTPVNAIGLFLNGPSYINFKFLGPIVITEINRNPPLEYEINGGTFIGVESNKFLFDTIYASGENIVIDDVAFARTTVPEPSSLVLFGSGLLTLFRRKHRKSLLT